MSGKLERAVAALRRCAARMLALRTHRRQAACIVRGRVERDASAAQQAALTWMETFYPGVAEAERATGAWSVTRLVEQAFLLSLVPSAGSNAGAGTIPDWPFEDMRAGRKTFPSHNVDPKEAAVAAILRTAVALAERDQGGITDLCLLSVERRHVSLFARLCRSEAMAARARVMTHVRRGDLDAAQRDHQYAQKVASLANALQKTAGEYR